MTHDFNRIIERRQTESIKWNLYDEDVLPMWVADMDFLCPPAVIEALRKRADHGVFGYAQEPPELRGIIVDRLKRRYDWTIQPDWITFPPNVFVGFHLAAHATCEPGDGVAAHTPIYFPILLVPPNVRLQGQLTEMSRNPDGRYEIDFDAFEASLDGRSKLFILCNPHNPIGRVYSRSELEQIAELCLKHDLAICSDEIHADFVYDGEKHIPIASLSPEIADRTITLYSPAKSFNIAGIGFSFAIIPNEELRKRYEEAKQGLVAHPGVMGYTAAVPALRDSDGWFEELLPYLQENRDTAARFVAEQIPGVSMTPLEGTYLAWLDCRSLGLDRTPHEFFLEKAKVATVDGAIFGAGGEGFARLNLACPRPHLLEGLGRIKRAIEARLVA